MTVTEVSGHGRTLGIASQWRVGEYRVDFLLKVKIDIVVFEGALGKSLNAITRETRTGEGGDGKIFVLPVANALRIRTGGESEKAI